MAPLHTLVLLLFPALALAQQPWDVSQRDGLLSIRANGAPAAELAAALADETGVRFVVAGDGGMKITTEIVDEPFAKAVAKLSPNHLLVRDGKGSDAPVIEVTLLLDESTAGGGGSGTEFLPSGAPADEVVADEQLFAPEEQRLGEAMNSIVDSQQGDAAMLEAPEGTVEELPADDQLQPIDSQ